MNNPYEEPRKELEHLANSFNAELHYHEIECNNLQHVASRVKMHKREAWIILPDDIWLVWSFNPVSMSNNTMNLSGIFFPVQNINKDFQLNIRSKDILDKLSLKRKNDQVRIDDFRFNSKHFITSNKPDICNVILSSSQKQEIIKDVLNSLKSFQIGINTEIPSTLHKKSSHIGIYTHLQWVTNKEEILKLIEFGTKLKEKFA